MGEIVIPPEVLTPALMDELRRIYRAEGLDFERYVVGGPVGPDGDSLNPVTGLREYFYVGDEDFTDTDFSFADNSSSFPAYQEGARPTERAAGSGSPRRSSPHQT